MGTRSYTIVGDEDGQPILNLHGQMDGFPHHHGIKLARFLAEGKLRDRVGGAAREFNDMGCLAAQLVAHLKTKQGGVYLGSFNNDNNASYGYQVVHVPEVRSGLWLTVLDRRNGEEIIFEGEPENVLSAIVAAAGGSPPLS